MYVPNIYVPNMSKCICFKKLNFQKRNGKKKTSFKIAKIMIIYAVLNGQWFNMYLKKAEQDRTFYTRNRLLTV